MRGFAPFVLIATCAVFPACRTQRGAEPSRGAVGISGAPVAAPPGHDVIPPPHSDEGDSGTFACGSQRCRVGRESCCTEGDLSACVPNAPPDPPGSPQLLATQIEACSKPPFQSSPGEIARCRSSSQCPEGELCCNEYLFSGASAIVCKPALPNELACAYGEMCTPDLPCRSPNTVCVKGECRKKAEVSCGKSTCELRTHTCVLDDPGMGPPRCVSDAELAARGPGPTFSVGCTSHADCQPGELCRSDSGRTVCQRDDLGMTATVCDSAADCPKTLCDYLKPALKKPACRHEQGFWHTVCSCQ